MTELETTNDKVRIRDREWQNKNNRQRMTENDRIIYIHIKKKHMYVLDNMIVLESSYVGLKT